MPAGQRAQALHQGPGEHRRQEDGETWIYYVVGTTIEVLLLLAIARTAWTWPREAAT